MIVAGIRRFPHLTGISLILVLACGLYLPFLGNLPVFDDGLFYSGRRFSYYATHPFGLDLRLPPYFSLAITEVISGRIEVHRVLSLVFHIACALALYRLIYDLLCAVRRTGGQESAPDARLNAATWAFMGAAVFAVHPVAVYGAGYLIQRSIVFATLFSLLSVVFFARGLARGSHADAISAALLYAVAVLSKEHALLLPAAAALTIYLVQSERRFAARHGAIYLAACAPAAILATLLSKGLLGEAYEPNFGAVAVEIEDVYGRRVGDFPWELSAVSQAGLFFKYVWLWLWPDGRAMSVDLRVDFLETWTAGWILLKLAAFAAWAALGFVLLRRRGRAGLAGFGLLYVWILFLAELSVARFQEPLVLYRSYLWAPGFLLTLAAVLSGAPRRAAMAGFFLVCPLLLYQAHDRLDTFSSPFALWKDAVAKLPATPVPGGSRTLYSLGREYLYRERPDKAIEITDRCMSDYPRTMLCHYARGAIHLQSGEFELALPYLSRARELDADSGVIYHRLGMALEGLDRLEEAKALYRRASELGFKGGDQEILRLESPGSGLSRARAKPPRSSGLSAGSSTIDRGTTP